MSLSGALYDSRDKTVTPGTFGIAATATPASSAVADAVESIDITVDGERLDYVSQQCPAGGCSLARSYSLDTEEFDGSRHRVEVVAMTVGGASRSSVFFFDINDPPEPVTQTEATYTDAQQDTAALRFRQDFGLDASQARIDAAQAESTSQATVPDYGVPLSAAELATTREADATGRSTNVLENYAATNAPDDYADLWLDWTQPGGLIHVGFKNNLSAHVAQMKALHPHPERIVGFQTNYGRRELLALVDRVTNDDAYLQTQGVIVNSVSFDPKLNRVVVTVDQPTAAISSTLASRYGPAITVTQGAAATEAADPTGPRSRYAFTVPKYAGQQIKSRAGRRCTLGFGAVGEKYVIRNRKLVKIRIPRARIEIDRVTTLRRRFFFGAGHCAASTPTFPDPVRNTIWRQGGRAFGKVFATSYYNLAAADALVYRIRKRSYGSRQVMEKAGAARTVEGAAGVDEDDRGEDLCFTGAEVGETRCGQRVGGSTNLRVRRIGSNNQTYFFKATRQINRECIPGDSGGPVWQNNGSRVRAFGIIIAVGDPNDGKCYWSHITHARNLLNGAVPDLEVAALPFP